MKYLISLKKLHLFGNKICKFSSGACGKLVIEEQHYKAKLNILILNKCKSKKFYLLIIFCWSYLHIVLEIKEFLGLFFQLLY